MSEKNIDYKKLKAEKQKLRIQIYNTANKLKKQLDKRMHRRAMQIFFQEKRPSVEELRLFLKSLKKPMYEYKKTKIGMKRQKIKTFIPLKQIKKEVIRQQKLKEEKKKLGKNIVKFKTKKISNVNVNLKFISPLNAIRTINELLSGENALLEINGTQFYTLNDANRSKLVKLAQGKMISEITDLNISDMEFEAMFETIRSLRLVRPKQTKFLKNGKSKKKNNGGFFKYLNKTDIDLSSYGIFKSVKTDNYKENCLYLALKEGGLNEKKLNKLKTIILNRNVPVCKLQKIAERLNICIQLKRNDGNKDRYFFYGDEDCKLFKIGLLEEHYFIIDKKIEITSYAVKHYNEINRLKDWNKIYTLENGRYKRKERFIDSWKLISLLLKHKDDLLKPITYNDGIYQTQFYDKINSFDNLEYCKDDYRENKMNTIKDNKFKKVFFDFETYKDEFNQHIPYLCCSLDEHNNPNTFLGEYSGKKLLESLNTDTLLIAHNAGYDYRFLLPYLFNVKIITKGTGLMNCDAMFHNFSTKKTIKIRIKDSYKLISMPLKKFGKCFKLNQTKEVMPYDLYNEENLCLRFVEIKEAFKFLKKDEIPLFLDNIDKWDLSIDDETFDIIKYSKEYCLLDCKVLKQGYEIFRKWMKKITKLDTDDFVSIASIAHNYLVSTNCYEDVYQLSGIPREFIQKCVIGGRTMTNSNKKYYVEEKLADFDAVSLYPSAMNRIEGFLKGLPKVITNLSYDWLKHQDGYFVEIKIKEVGIKRQFPLMSYINKDNVRCFCNDEMIGKTIFIDKVGLEDLIKFQKVEFEILKGYYYNDGRNENINDVIENLFNERLKMKKLHNPIEMVYKLLMNSSYGKSILKPIENEEKVFNNKEELDNYVSLNYNSIQEYTQVKGCNKYIVKIIKPINEHFNNCHVGVEILSMSKRIMNEVICLAEDKGYTIYYQDTDSIHIKYNEVAELYLDYKQKYNRELIGKGMGQFHIDFKLEKKDNDDNIIWKVDKPYAVKSIFLGKKCYIDLLEGYDKDGKKHNDYHIRMKGIPTDSVLYEAKQLGISEMELYKKLHDKEEIEFDLLCGGKKCNFKFHKDMSIESLTDFKRKISF